MTHLVRIYSRRLLMYITKRNLHKRPFQTCFNIALCQTLVDFDKFEARLLLTKFEYYI